MYVAKIAPAEFDLFTGGKQSELAIAFNLACDNIQKYINTLMNWTPGTVSLEMTDKLDDRAFVYLREYLWKGNSENKNSSGYALEQADKSIIQQLLEKLSGLRNFHSHYWHDNNAVRFSDELRLFVQNKHDRACGQLLESKSIDAEIYFRQQQRFPLFKNGQFITQEGRVFFLSFFLNKGQMQNLLQRRRGSKRHDLPEYKFKHKLFTYYCHREGAAWLTTGIDNTVLPSMDEDEKQRIHAGRQANRILSHLKDRPVAKDKEALPLVLADGNWVVDMASLIAFISENDMLPGFYFFEIDRNAENDLLDESGEPDSAAINEENKHREKLKREGFRRFAFPEDPRYAFEISYSVLRQIVTDIFLDDHNTEQGNDPTDERKTTSRRNHFIRVLKDCIDTRMYIYESLKEKDDQPLTPENYALSKRYSSIYIKYYEHEGSLQEKYYTGDEWRAIPISPTLRVEKLLIQWHRSFTMGGESEPVHRMKLLNAIRPKTEPFQPPASIGRRAGKWAPTRSVNGQEPEPLLFHLAYYYREQRGHARMEDGFLEWGIRYLIDMGLVPDWYFEMEQLVYEPKFNEPESPYKLKKAVRWEKEIPENHRLYITDNQLNIGIRREGRFYRLRVGERVLKYLLHWHFHGKDKQGKSINDFLLAVTEDLSLLQGSKENIDPARFALLEKFAIPELFFKTKVQRASAQIHSGSSYKDQAREFFLSKICWIDEQLAGMSRMSRNQKNKTLLDTYRLFDFSVTEGSKFLRKNEYEQMGICHYMFYQDSGKIRSLIEKTFRLNRRLPSEILRLIYGVAGQVDGSLEDLCLQVLQDRKKYLQDRLSLLKNPGLKTRQVRKEVTEGIAIYFDDANLTEEELGVRNQARKESFSHIPFAIHPALVLKYFYPGVFAQKGFCKEGGRYQNLFLQLRTDFRLSNALPSENYREAAHRKIIASYAARFPDNSALSRYKKKWVEQMNLRKAKDILLLEVAEGYLEKYDPRALEDFRQVRTLKRLNLEKLFSAPSLVPIPIDQEAQQEMDMGLRASLPRPIFLQLRLHNIDDYFYRTQKANLFRLAVFYLHWRAEELHRYRDHPALVDQLSKWPDGSKNYPLTIGSLIEARKTIADQAAELVEYIAHYEAGILNMHHFTSDKQSKQGALLQFSRANEAGTYISFYPTILGWDDNTPADIKNKIRDLRNHCLHNLIPLNGSYRQQSMPGGGVAEALHIHKPLGKDRTERSIYEIYEENESSDG